MRRAGSGTKIVIALAMIVGGLTQWAGPVDATATRLSPSPAVVTVGSGGTVTVHVMQHADAGSMGTQADVRFDRTRFSVVSVVAGAGYPGAAFRIGTPGQTPAQAIAEANTSTGVVRAAQAFYAPGGGPAAGGDIEFAVVTMTALQNVTNVPTLALPGVLLLDPAYGDLSPVVTLDTDNDGCMDGKESFLYPAIDPLDPWDFYSVPVPALFSAPDPTVVFRDSTVSASDAQAVFAYFKKGAHTGTLEYEQDLNLNAIKDGVEYDRSFVSPGHSGPPDGVISAQDSQLVNAQFKLAYHC